MAHIAALALGWEAWADALTALIAIVLAASVSAMTVAGGRVYARRAADGELPARLTTLAVAALVQQPTERL